VPISSTVRRELRELRRQIDELKATTENPLLAELREDPAQILSSAGLPPDAWQAQLLRTAAQRILLLCSRQSGKSTTAAALALRTSLLEANSLTLLLSPSLRQSSELFKKVQHLYNTLGRPVPSRQESALTMQLANGSRVVSLPGDEQTVRGYSGVDLLVLDEAALVPDSLYVSVRPMLAVSQGRMICLSTPHGRRGWFHAAWTSAEDWERVEIKASQCPRISPEFLAEEKASMGEYWYRQEYLTSFEENLASVFRETDLQAMLTDAPPPLWS
jgi:phage terminase large subunit-like protein